jgi:DNA mismatch endonuclease (patch repair protein)
MMSGIRARDTQPEMQLRKALHARGLRYRLHDTRLPGKPDLVFPKWRAVVFVHGCFWHGHGCRLFKWPATRAEWWRAKIGTNMARDVRNQDALTAMGWRALVVWECDLRGSVSEVASTLHHRLAG